MVGRPKSRRESVGFTLIELLIVIAIILILIAIALPNFISAQTRAKIVQVKGNQRTIHTAMESYYTDFNLYPPMILQSDNGFLSTVALATLTTPIQYLTDTQAMTDIFTKGLQAPVPGFEDGQPMLYLNYQEFVRFMQFGTEPVFDAWMVLSFGPNLKFESFAPNTPSIAYAPYPGWDVDPRFADNAYNPTNGLRSDGDIMKGGGPQMPAKAKLLLGFQ